MYASSLASRWDLAIVDGLQRLHAWDFFGITPLGHAANVFAVGTAVLWLPFVAGAYALSRLVVALGGAVTIDGIGAQYVYAIGFATAFYGYLTLCLTYRCVTTVTSSRGSFATVLLIALATPFAYYSYSSGSYSHVPAAFCVSLLLYWRVVRWPSARSEPRSAVVLGAIAGLCGLVRPELLLLGVTLGLELLLPTFRSILIDRRLALRRCLPICGFTLAAAGMFAPQCIVWWSQFGKPFVVPQGSGFFRLTHPLILKLLFSSHHGAFAWAPVLLIATTGLFVWPRTDPGTTLRKLCVVLLLPQIYLYSVVFDVDAGASFGARRLVPMTPVFAFGLAAVLVRLPIVLSAVPTIASTGWTVLLLAVYKWSIIDRAQFVTWRQIGQAVADAIRQFPVRAETWQCEQLVIIRNALNVSHAAMIVVLAGILVVTLIVVGAKRMMSSAMISERAAGAIAGAMALGLPIAFALAASRTMAAAVPAIVENGSALLDFRTYANSRSDSNPFWPGLKAMTRCPGLSGRHTWNGVPFMIAPPAEGHEDRPSVVTTCGPSEHTLTLPLTSRGIRRVHIAAVSHSPLRSGSVGSLVVTMHDGQSIVREIRDDAVRDVSAFVPESAIVARSLFTAIQGVSLNVDGQPASLHFRKPFQAGACMAVFAVTIEDASGALEPVDIRPISNANHAVDYFAATPRVNYFPDLRPGTLVAEGRRLLVVPPAPWISGGNTLAVMLSLPFRQRLPLQVRQSEALWLLIDGNALPAYGTPVVKLRIEYTDGSEAVDILRAGVHVESYDRSAAAPVAWRGRGLQDLTLHRVELDAHRRSQYLWIESLGPQTDLAAAVAIFAITQQFAE